jgi:hypothetical protein
MMSKVVMWRAQNKALKMVHCYRTGLHVRTCTPDTTIRACMSVRGRVLATLMLDVTQRGPWTTHVCHGMTG